MRCATGGSASSRRPPRSSMPRHLGGEVGLAAPLLGLARARARARSARLLATTAARRKTTSATQFSPSRIVKRPVGGMWKKLKAARSPTAVAMPSQAPQSEETSSTATR